MRLRWSILRSAASHKCMIIKRYCVCAGGYGCLSGGTQCHARLCTTVQFERSFVYCAITNTMWVRASQNRMHFGRLARLNYFWKKRRPGEDLKVTVSAGDQMWTTVRFIGWSRKVPWNSTARAIMVSGEINEGSSMPSPFLSPISNVESHIEGYYRKVSIVSKWRRHGTTFIVFGCVHSNVHCQNIIISHSIHLSSLKRVLFFEMFKLEVERWLRAIDECEDGC